MLTGDESLHELYERRAKLQSALKRLHGPERRMKEDYLQDIDAAIEKLKKKRPGHDEVLY